MSQRNIPPPKELNLSSGNRSRNFDIFKQAWSNFEIATELECKEMKIRRATLLSIIGTEALEVYNTFEWTEDLTVENILLKFESFCKPKKNITYERFLLLTRKQREDEKVDDFAKALRSLAETCEYGSLKNSIIKDAFVLGIFDNRVRENLLKDCELTLETAINIARATEKAKEQSSAIRGDNESNVMKVSRTHKTNEKTNDCKFCGREHEFKKISCPAFGKKCSKCGLKNHFAAKCKTNNVQMIDNIEDVNPNTNEEIDDLYIK